MHGCDCSSITHLANPLEEQGCLLSQPCRHGHHLVRVELEGRTAVSLAHLEMAERMCVSIQTAVVVVVVIGWHARDFMS
jgi:hypothetical protein